MKKIIATVLAMVMALALCTTAFAADPTYTKAFCKDDTDGHKGTYTVKTDVAVKYNKVTGAGEVKTFYVEDDSNAFSDKHYVESTAADYDLKLTADGRNALYLSEVNDGGAYVCKAVAFKAIGEKCEQLDVDPDETYYTNDGNYQSSDDVVYFVKSSIGSVNVLVDGKLVRVDVVNEELVDHDWEAASWNKDNTVATFKCAECGTVATVYKTVDAAKAAGVGTIVVDATRGILGYTYTAPGTVITNDTTTTTTSPKTFDAGIAMYVGMALTSVAGSAVVIGKKKEF